MMSDEDLKQLIASNAKAIEALTNSLSEERQERQKTWDKLQQNLSQEREERQKERIQFYQMIADMQRQFIDLGRRIDNNSADIRELAIENQRILRYLESLVNRPGDF